MCRIKLGYRVSAEAWRFDKQTEIVEQWSSQEFGNSG